MIPYSKLCRYHDRTQFDCGNETLNLYLREQVGQDVRRNLTKCYVVCEDDTYRVIAFMTLSNCSIDSSLLGYPYSAMYADIPMTKIGRLAVDKNFKGRGIGSDFLDEALNLAAEGPAASCGIVVDAKDDNVLRWYLKRQMKVLRTNPLQCFALLPVSRHLPKDI